MTGRKTHEQQIRTLERKPDVPDARNIEGPARPPADSPRKPDAGARAAEFPVSRSGMNTESDHAKHNRPDQPGHRRQKHGPDEEKS